MTKKTQKSKSLINRPRNNDKSVSFNMYSFVLGNITILTDYLSKDLRDAIIQLYRQKKFDKNLYEQKSQLNTNGKEQQKYAVLTELQAVQIMKQVNLGQNKCHKFQKILKTSPNISKYLFISKQVNSSFKTTQLKKPSVGACALSPICSIEGTNQWQKQSSQLKLKKDLTNRQILDFIKKSCINIEKQLFVESIVMIIEHQADLSEAQSTIIFEQSYQRRRVPKLQLIQLIGLESYSLKAQSAIKIYHYSLKDAQFYNPSCVTCHDCMKVIGKFSFPENELNCKKVVESQDKAIKSLFAFTPQSYLQKIINKEHFVQNSSTYTHPYISYYFPVKGQKLACNRYWCGNCYLKHKQGMNLNQCEFCDRVCLCFRCKKFGKFIELQAHYLNLGGKLEEIEKNSIFERIFNKFQFVKSEAKTGRNIVNVYKEELKAMYEAYPYKLQREVKQGFQALIAGVNAQDVQFYVPENQTLKNLQKRIVRKNFSYQTIKSRDRSLKKQSQIQKQLNTEALINKFTQGQCQKFKKLHEGQFMNLKRKFQLSGIFKTTDPLNSARNAKKEADIVIFSESQLKKNQRKFESSLQFKELNPFKRVIEQRQYLKVKRQGNASRNLQLNQKIEQQQERNQKQAFFIGRIIQKQKNEEQNKNIQKSIWQ